MKIKPAEQRPSDERGSAALTAAVGLIFFGFCGLVTDAGIVLIARTQLVLALDAAVLAAAQELPSEPNATNLANTYFDLNMSTNPMVHGLNIDVSFPEDRHVRAVASADVDTVFLRVLGLDTSKVSYASQAERVDPDLALVVDRSGSMCEDTHGVRLRCPGRPGRGPVLQPMQSVKNAASLFTLELDPGVRMALASYSTDATLDQRLTANHAALTQAIQTIHPTGYTDIGAAVDEATRELVLNAREDHPRIMVLITDGRPNVINGRVVGYGFSANQSVRNAAINAAAADVQIYSIAFGDNTDEGLMRDLADITGGIYYAAPTTSDLMAVFQDIADKRLVRLVVTVGG